LDASILEGDGHSSQNGCIALGFLQKSRGTVKIGERIEKR